METLDDYGTSIELIEGLEGCGDKKLLLSDDGTYSVLYTFPNGGYGIIRGHEFQQGNIASIDELRATLEAIRVSLVAAGFEMNMRTAVALAVLAYCYCQNEYSNADRFHQLVKGVTPFLTYDVFSQWAQGFQSTGDRVTCSPVTLINTLAKDSASLLGHSAPYPVVTTSAAQDGPPETEDR